MKLAIPDFALVCLIGASGSGKSSFAAQHFKATEVVSSDECRTRVTDDATTLDANEDTFELLQYIASMRLKRRMLTVIDATSVQKADRAHLVSLGRRFHALPVAIVLDLDPALCEERNKQRKDRTVKTNVAQRHSKSLRKNLRGLQKEGFRQVYILRSLDEIESVSITREPLWTDQRGEHGPFDIIGDVHGCYEELNELLLSLGYVFDQEYEDNESLLSARHPQGRQAFFVGDITDRGPRNRDCLRLVMGMCANGSARIVVGNHDYKLLQYLRGKKVNLTHGLDLTAAELSECSDEFRQQVSKFIYDIRSHQWLDDGNLVIAHAGLKESMHGRGSGAVRSFAMFGETSGAVDEFGLPVRLEWARDYRGKASVVFGHTPVPDAQWLNNTICLDTGCVFGGKLTALRWPEKEIIEVNAHKEYAAPVKPIAAVRGFSAQQDHDLLLYFDDFVAKQRIECRLGRAVTIPEENALAALESMSRFGIDPRWLIYLPPTMAACPTTPSGAYLEHPQQALEHYRSRGIEQLVAEEKHMGSRALLVVTRNPEVASSRFGTDDGKAGVVYTRTGKAYFNDDALEAQIIARISAAMQASGLWQELKTDWVLLDAELLPWSAKALEMINAQYLTTAIAAENSASMLLEALGHRTLTDELSQLKEKAVLQQSNAQELEKVVGGYCWPVNSIEDYRIAPFHILAAEGHVFVDQPHSWHMQLLEKLAAEDAVLTTTGWKEINPFNDDDCESLITWWTEHTGNGGEGLVLKPMAFTVRGSKGLIQPAMKMRGKEYLRIIYGPDYDMPQNIERLRDRGLGKKFSLAEREYVLGLEGLYRFVEKAPLAEVHACALGVLALESEPVDPRL